jgi:hypothetical protein
MRDEEDATEELKIANELSLICDLRIVNAKVADHIKGNNDLEAPR